MTLGTTFVMMLAALPGIARRAMTKPAVRALVVSPAPTEVVVAPRPSWSASRRLRVLVVDDRPLIGEQVARMLIAHDVTRVTSAEAAVTRARQGGLDAVVYALAMPGLSGFAFSELVPAMRSRLVFLLDRTPSSGLLGKVARTGAQWITKPLHYAALATAVDFASAAPHEAPMEIAAAA